MNMFFIEGIMQSLNATISSHGMLGFFIIIILQAIVAPIPGEVVMMTGGATIGVLNAGIIGAIAGCIGATICFFISKKGGRPLVVKVIGKKGLNFGDKWFKKHGIWAVLFARLIPLIPVDAISYVAGLTAMGFTGFIIATIIGLLPRAFFYAYLGELAAKQVETMGIERTYMNTLLILITIISVITASIYFLKRARSNRTVISPE
jgi:uncharacterized membrane protein YdjX (TVP38/TMEM64 family)